VLINPEGPYTDHGPLIYQEVGSVMLSRCGMKTASFTWKEDTNSVNKASPIWIQELNENGLLWLRRKDYFATTNLGKETTW